MIRRVSSLERGLYAAPALLEKFGEPRTLEELARLPMLTGPNDAPWALTTPAGVTEHLTVQKARLVSSNADIRLQAALAGLGVLRVTASFTDAAVEADCCGGSSPIMSASRLTFTRHCRPGSSFPQKCDASSMRWMPTAGRRRNARRAKSNSLTSEVNP